jgi:hypothetical protein
MGSLFLKKEYRIYPILGFDWKISSRWSLNVVYPMNISLNYAITPQWIFALAGRNLNTRFRVHKDEYLCKSLIRYTNVGGECAIKFQSELLTANVHGGLAFAGKLRIANQENHHPSNYKLEPSLYAGFEVEIKF